MRLILTHAFQSSSVSLWATPAAGTLHFPARECSAAGLTLGAVFQTRLFFNHSSVLIWPYSLEQFCRLWLLFLFCLIFFSFFFFKKKGTVVTGARISYSLWQHVPIKFRSLFVLLWLIFKVIENSAEVIAGKIDLTVLHKCQQRQGDTFREVTNNSRADGEGEASTHTVPFKQADTCVGHFENNAKNVALCKAWQWPWVLNHFDRCVKCRVWGYRAKKLGLPVKCGMPAPGLRPRAGWGGRGHGVSPSQGNLKGAKNLNSTPGNSGHMSSVTHVVTQRVTLHQRPRAKSETLAGWGCGLSPHAGPPAGWAGGARCLPSGSACSPPCAPPVAWLGTRRKPNRKVVCEGEIMSLPWPCTRDHISLPLVSARPQPQVK